MCKKMIAFIIAAALLVLCCGCSGGGDSEDVSSEVNSMPVESTISSETTESEANAMLNITVKSKETDKFSSTRPHDDSKEDISLILVVGQSNFTTSVGYAAEYGALENGKTANVPEAPLQPQKGIAYSFGVSTSITGLTEGRDMNKLCNPQNGTATLGGVTPSFAIQWNALTGTKVVFIQAAVGAVGVHEWTQHPDEYTCTCTHNGKGLLYANAVTAYQNAYDVLSKQYNIAYTGYIWNQGEHEEVYAKEGNTVCDAESYYNAYKDMHDGLMQTLQLDFGGISVVRADKAGKTADASTSYTVARAAQYKLCNDLDDLYMLSTISETCSSDMMDQGNTIHYSQSVFNVMGVEMANTLFNVLGFGDSAEYSGVRIYTADGLVAATFDKDGKLSSGSDVISRSTVGKNIIVRLDTLGTAYTLEYKLDLDGEDASKYIDGFGAIDWTGLESDKNIKEIKVNVTVE